MKMNKNCNNRPLLSIIIPIYNVEPYIEKCLQSIYLQIADLPVEIVLVNDGTPDHSMDIAAKFVDEKTIVVNQKNQGLSVARNHGVEASHGKYVWFVDSDDWIAPSRIKEACGWIKEYEQCEVLVVGIKAYNEEGIPIPSFHAVSPVSEPTVKSGAEWLLTPNFERGPMQIFIIARSYIDEHKLQFVQGLLHEDLEYAPRMLVESDSVAYIPEDIYCYLIRSKGSITSTVNPKRFSDIYSILESHEKVLASFPRGSMKQEAIKASQWMLLRVLIAYLKRQKYTGFSLCSSGHSALVRKVAWRSVFCKMKLTYKIKFLLTSIYPNVYKYIKW